ncbi:MAG: hypothetical protein AB3N63_19975 [Puniceicoccaceae bacterium]
MDLSNIEFPLRRPDGGYLGMTTLGEQDWCRDYAASRFKGNGALVELGSFMGSLTIPLAEGLKEAIQSGHLDKAAARIHVYDLFYWHRSMIPVVEDTPLSSILNEGDWFFDVYKANTAHVEDMLEITWGDLGKEQWNGDEIEFLLLDCLKYDEITNNVIQSFFPATRPGLSSIAHQDYFHFYEWWTHLITFEQRGFLEIAEAVPDSGMLILDVKKDLSKYCADYDPQRDFSKTTPEQIEAAYAWNFSVIQEAFHQPLKAARIWAYVWTGNPEKARQLYNEASPEDQLSPAFQDMKLYCDTEGFPF